MSADALRQARAALADIIELAKGTHPSAALIAISQIAHLGMHQPEPPAPEPDPTARLTDADIQAAVAAHELVRGRIGTTSRDEAVAAARAVLRAALTREEPNETPM